MGRRKRDTYADSPIFYNDIFPGYPPGLRMREDVAEFVSLITHLCSYRNAYTLCHVCYSTIAGEDRRGKLGLVPPLLSRG